MHEVQGHAESIVELERFGPGNRSVSAKCFSQSFLPMGSNLLSKSSSILEKPTYLSSPKAVPNAVYIEWSDQSRDFHVDLASLGEDTRNCFLRNTTFAHTVCGIDQLRICILHQIADCKNHLD